MFKMELQPHVIVAVIRRLFVKDFIWECQKRVTEAKYYILLIANLRTNLKIPIKFSELENFQIQTIGKLCNFLKWKISEKKISGKFPFLKWNFTFTSEICHFCVSRFP